MCAVVAAEWAAGEYATLLSSETYAPVRRDEWVKAYEDAAVQGMERLREHVAASGGGTDALDEAAEDLENLRQALQDIAGDADDDWPYDDAGLHTEAGLGGPRGEQEAAAEAAELIEAIALAMEAASHAAHGRARQAAETATAAIEAAWPRGDAEWLRHWWHTCRLKVEGGGE